MRAASRGPRPSFAPRIVGQLQHSPPRPRTFRPRPSFFASPEPYRFLRSDIDIWVRPTRANAERVLAALRRFGAPLFDLTVEDLADEQTVFQIGMPPVRIDILAGIDGVTFDEAWARREMADLGSLRAPVLAVVDLIANKRAAGRPKDLVDLAWLEALPARR